LPRKRRVLKRRTCQLGTTTTTCSPPTATTTIPRTRTTTSGFGLSGSRKKASPHGQICGGWDKAPAAVPSWGPACRPERRRCFCQSLRSNKQSLRRRIAGNRNPSPGYCCATLTQTLSQGGRGRSKSLRNSVPVFLTCEALWSACDLSPLWTRGFITSPTNERNFFIAGVLAEGAGYGLEAARAIQGRENKFSRPKLR